jgi:hypothetical protein
MISRGRSNFDITTRQTIQLEPKIRPKTAELSKCKPPCNTDTNTWVRLHALLSHRSLIDAGSPFLWRYISKGEQIPPDLPVLVKLSPLRIWQRRSRYSVMCSIAQTKLITSLSVSCSLACVSKAAGHVSMSLTVLTSRYCLSLPNNF